MRVKVLGSAAGGGFPQWNCGCSNCRRVRVGGLRGRARSQTQLAFTTNSKVWFLLSASPDLRSQITAAKELWPSGPASTTTGDIKKKPGDPVTTDVESPIGGVFLSGADVDGVAGLLHLREFQSFFIFATPAVQRILRKENPIFHVLERGDPPVKWVSLSSKGRLGCHLDDELAAPPEFLCTTVPLGGSYPDYVSPDVARTLPWEEASSGFVIHRGEKKFFYAPAISPKSESWQSWAENCDVAFVDGTFWSDNELCKTGRSDRTAREMGHLPLSGPGGLLEQYPKNGKGRKILIHINNTNPILDEDSAEHRRVLDAGFEVAWDGLEVEV